MNVVLAASYAMAGRGEEAEDLISDCIQNKPKNEEFENILTAYKRSCPNAREQNLWRDGFQKAGFLN